VVILAASVIMRYVVNEPLDWIEEAGMLILVWMTFLGAVLAAAEKKHMGMDLLLTKLNGKMKKIVPAAISIITIISLLFVIYYGVDMTLYNLTLESESLQISYAYFYLAIPVGCLLYAIVELQQLIQLARKK
jgi:TRAP-type C4-dicarboxylate transport system permease small subunit